MPNEAVGPRPRVVVPAVLTLVVLGLASSGLVACSSRGDGNAHRPNPTGASLIGGSAPDIVDLVDQFHHPQRLSDYRGKVVLLTFVSSRCTNVCPLTAELLTRTEQLLGGRAVRTQLIAVNANIVHRSVSDVLRWSQQHRMTHRWLFLTGPVGRLEPVYEAYDVTPGSAHTVAIFVIDPQGKIRTEIPIASQKGIDAEAKVVARYVGSLIPS
jgi:cytochrome oxidase Cu insertion factor (SCO1/SenC/PrrC family)